MSWIFTLVAGLIGTGIVLVLLGFAICGIVVGIISALTRTFLSLGK